ncbi:MAG: CYTH domain-containing protein [Parcubacteria group bacterium]|nr:CYTH domain-containing protein [Parcubacteria group bacterium]
MKEIELKVLGIDRQALRARLRKIGARRVFGPVPVREIYFEPDKSMRGARRYSSFRLRAVGKHYELTVKVGRKNVKQPHRGRPAQKIQKFKVRDEYEVRVLDFARALELVRALGYRVFREREKTREEYRHQGVKIEIDEYTGMPPYMELESTREHSLLRVLGALGYNREQATTATATELLARHGLDTSTAHRVKRHGHPKT